MKAARFIRYLHGLLFAAAVCLGACGGSGSPVSAPPSDDLPPPEASEPLPDSQTDHAFLTDHFSGSDNCALCHDGLQASDGTDVSIVADWQAGMMANSARDPFWRAKVASEVRRNPALQQEIEATCARCHAPMAHVEAQFAAADILLFGSGFLNPDNALFDAAAEGVSCTLCHQIADTAALGTVQGFSGQFDVPYSFGVDRVLLGQYDNPLTMPMRNQAGFTPSGSEHISLSKTCASCHNLFTPVVDAAGNLTEEVFPEQMVYTEWEHSDFAETDSCIDCHMPGVGGNVRIASRPVNGLPARPDFSRHLLAGGSSLMLDLIGQNAATLRITATGFEAMADTSRSLLESAADVDLEALGRDGDDLVFGVRVSNKSGHKFPTSYPSRRAWLHVVVADAAGAVVFESGAIDAAGRIAGLNSDTDVADFEPHHRTITGGEQVQSYESIMEDRDGSLTYTLLRAAAYRKDNRLLPAGMDKMIAPSTIRPRGDALDDPDFADGSDLVHFRIAGLPANTYSIQVDLNYQALAYGHAADLFEDAEEPRVAAFQMLHDGAPVRFETVASASDSIDF